MNRNSRICKRSSSGLAANSTLWNIELEAEQRIKVVEVASRPQGDDSLTKYLGVGFAGIVGFGMVLFGLAYVEFQSRRLNSASEVKDGLGLQVVGELPILIGQDLAQDSIG